MIDRLITLIYSSYIVYIYQNMTLYPIKVCSSDLSIKIINFSKKNKMILFQELNIENTLIQYTVL